MQGMLNLFAALEWVRGNICNFGAEPIRLTAFGRSAAEPTSAL
jgi:carboxylesterase type B